MNIRVRFQPRYDLRDFMKAGDGRSYVSGNDLYMRRVRLSMEGWMLTKVLKYQVEMTADRWEQANRTYAYGLQYANLEYIFDDYLIARIGKSKLPFSRVSLVSSARQLIVERPASTEAAKGLFGKSEAYYQPAMTLRGSFLDGTIYYEGQMADGWQNGDVIYTRGSYYSTDSADTIVRKGQPFYGARLELSPPGWVESKKSDAPLGQGKHLTGGVHFGAQKEITYQGNLANLNLKEDRTVAGYDISGHYKGFTAAFEYNSMLIDFSEFDRFSKAPKGWYAQAGYFIDNFDLNLEPVFRYEVYNTDSNKPKMGQTAMTSGINWYLKGHSLKVGFNWVETRYEDKHSGALKFRDATTGEDIIRDNMMDQYQLQGQLLF
jgi:hypothetical protein